MPKREGVRLDQLNQKEVLEGGEEVPTGTFQKASEDVLQKRRIVRARRSTATKTSDSAAPSSNPFANIKFPANSTDSNALSKEEDSSSKKDLVEAKVAVPAPEDKKDEDPADTTAKGEKQKEEEENADTSKVKNAEEKEDKESLKRQKTESTTIASSFADFKPTTDSKKTGFGQFSFGGNTSGFSFGNATGFGALSKAPGFAEVSSSNAKAASKSETSGPSPNILPQTFDVQTGEEDEECLCGPLKCKIFKYVPSTKSATEAVAAPGVPPSKSNDEEKDEPKKEEEETLVWKSFGIGEVKILQHKETKNVRIVQRNGPTVVLNERLKDSVKMTLQGENELRLKFLDSCNLVALKVNKTLFGTFVDAIKPHVSQSD